MARPCVLITFPLHCTIIVHVDPEGGKDQKHQISKPYKIEIVKKNKLKESCGFCWKVLKHLSSKRRTFFLAMNIWERLLLAGLIEQRDSQPLLKLMESVGDWPVAFEDWNSTMGKSNLSCLKFVLNYYPLAACTQGRESPFKYMCLLQKLACVARHEILFS